MWKKRLALLLALLMLISILPTTAFAATPTTRADMLKDLGLFLGTPTGYHLERAPTRAEAAVMLVRSLGKVDAAKAAAYKTPFTDVPDWAADAVGYLYHEGLTKGTGATKYSANRACEAKMYVTFILRALGYKDAVDFNYESAASDAVALDVLESYVAIILTIFNDPFTRGDMVDITWCALSAKVAYTQTMLLDKLVTDGAVVESKAAKYREELLAFAAVRTAGVLLYDDEPAYQLRRKTSSYVKTGAEVWTLTSEETVMAQRRPDGSWDQLYEENGISLEGNPTSTGVYVKDGWLYAAWQDNPKEKYEVEPTANNLFPIYLQTMVSPYMMALLPRTFQSTKSTETGRVSEYTLSFEDIFEITEEELNEMMAAFDPDGNVWSSFEKFKTRKINITVETDVRGRLTRFKSEEYFFEEIEGQKVESTATTETTISYDTGDIPFPDLTGYSTVSDGPMDLYDAYVAAMGWNDGDEDESE